MGIEPDHLITFATVAKHLSMTAAADELHKSQPAISIQMKRLSEAIGEPLLRRGRHGVELTSTGADLLPFAQAVQRAHAGAVKLRQGLRAAERGIVQVAASMTLAVYVLPALLAEFHRDHPNLELRLLTRNSEDALALLQRAEADIALVEGRLPAIPDGLSVHTLFHDEIVLAVGPHHPLASRQRLTPEDLVGLEIVQREPGSGTREVVEDALDAMGLPHPGVAVSLEATGIDAVKEAVIQGFGTGFISRLAIRREVSHGELVALSVDAPGFWREMTLIHPAEELQSQAVRVFLEAIGRSVSGGRFAAASP